MLLKKQRLILISGHYFRSLLSPFSWIGSVFSHVVFLLLLSISWACKRRMMPISGTPKPLLKNTYFSYYRSALISCLSFSFCQLLLFVLNSLSDYNYGWPHLKAEVLPYDLSIKTLTWFANSAYLHFQFSQSGDHRFPILLRAWWAFYCLMSCSYLSIHMYLHWKYSLSLPFLLWFSDATSIIAGLLLCNAAIFGKEREDNDALLVEPLLNSKSNPSSVENKEGSNCGGENVSPYANANILSIFTFSWVNPLLALGCKKRLDLEDVPHLANRNRAKVVFAHCRSKLEPDGNKMDIVNHTRALKLVKILILSIRKEILLTALFSIIDTLASYIGPYLIDAFVQYLNSPHQLKDEGYMLILVFFLSKLIRSLSQRHLFFQLRNMGNIVRTALLAISYKKVLKLSSQSKRDHSSGENINLISVDIERIGFFSWYLHNIWKVPLQIVLALLILYKNLGLASLVAFVTTIVLMLANVPLGKLQDKFQGKLMDSKDQRMKMTSESLKNMSILKLHAWEMKFLDKIIELRKLETKWLKKLLYTSALTGSVYMSAPMFVSMVTFGFCVLMGIPLESGKILSALTTLEILRGPIYNLPSTISMVVQAKISLDRITTFLYLDDLDSDIVQRLQKDCDEVAIEMVNGSFSWDLQLPNPTLKNLNFRVCHGMKVAICGTIGSGKSSLISCILGEMPKVSGTIMLNGTKAYVPQSPWIQSGKIADNILFGKEMNKKKYEMILKACSLTKDLESLDSGDQTIVGDKGVNLSGGQKQRIQIARALYYDADIYLLDDPFSAVDVHTGTHLVKVMKDGKITQAGKHEEILNSGTDFMDLVNPHQKTLAKINSIEHGGDLDKLVNSEENDSNMLHGKKSTQDDMERESIVEEKTEDAIGPGRQLVQEETREKGGIGLSLYWKYFTTAHKGALVPFILLAEILYQLLRIISSYWIVLATPISKDKGSHYEGSTIIFVYITLTLGRALCELTRIMLIVTTGYKTATILFSKMHLSIFHAPLSFFDSTPSGRILNRASTDQSVVDTSIPRQIEELLISTIDFLGTIVVMSQISWQMLIIFIPMSATCVWYQRYYVPAARELSRIVGVCQTPILQHFTESNLGSTIIRCFNQEERFMDTNLKLVDEYFRPKFYLSGAMEWLCFRMEMLASITYAFSLAFLILVLKGVLNPGVLGLTVTYGLSFSMHGVIWDLSSLENKIISVERILQYVNIPKEPPLVIGENRPSHEWPSQGKVDIANLRVRYAPHLPIILRGLTCTFLGGTKIGIVGRTGSGKSTLIKTLFRLLEPTVGQICIDGVNISTIGLHDLRSRLSIIPQDPIMFEGTLRSNIDPLEEYSDEEIWEALDKCQLGDEVRKKEGKLDFIVTENGENWSMGQRQLACLGRVLLKRNKVLILDEATASVDAATDYIIQKTLREHFSEATIIIVAHRISSILDTDMVLLLDNGRIMEYDSPTKLLEIKTSLFAKLVKEHIRRCSS